MHPDLPLSTTHEVRDRCLCLHLQRAARHVGRRFDEALRPLQLTNGQFSLLMALNRPGAPKLGEIATLLVMDRTTLTANLKPLVRRNLLTIEPDPADRRSRRLLLSDKGRKLLLDAMPVWRAVHDAIDAELASVDSAPILKQLLALSFD
ncbi:MarR family transcriptional regulator [uncultured Roseibium sp.]|uniref:MarR family winged helix-turn-helix transcriptional regulator n=1 Tax=uncultured Roseibium sp. TaxID=1936171 RepID=UPI0026193F45|nr:MarR family transcriptional regulator [uncultured Roseibium sp.]